MGFTYAVVGAGRQGTAAAYDFALRGKAEDVLLADLDLKRAKAAADRVDGLVGTTLARGVRVDVTRQDSVLRALKGVDVFLSAVPYPFNLRLAKAAVRAKASMVDLGGHTETAKKQLALDPQAKRAGIAIIPECGMGPGANVTLAVHAIRMLDRAEEVRVYDGGLPQRPRPPWDYELTFNIAGLTNEYTGIATFLRNGELVEVPGLSDVEAVDIPPLGPLEAAVTTGGLSTMPWTYRGALRVLENKTLRYPGHWARIRGFADLGLLSERPVTVRGRKVVPRDLFHALFEPQVTPKEIRDIAVTHVVARGTKDGRPADAIVDMVDLYDEKTGFRAMERVTGWHAAIAAEMIARGEIGPGAHPVETGIPPERFVEEARKRRFSIKTGVHPLG